MQAMNMALSFNTEFQCTSVVYAMSVAFTSHGKPIYIGCVSMNVINVYTMSVCKMQARDTNVSGLCMLQTWPSSNTELYGCGIN